MNFALDASSADGIQDGGGNLRENQDLSGFVKPLFDAQLSFETKKLFSERQSLFKLYQQNRR